MVEAVIVDLTDEEVELLQDAVSAWIADYIMRVAPKHGSHSLNDARAVERFNGMVAVGNKLEMEL